MRIILTFLLTLYSTYALSVTVTNIGSAPQSVVTNGDMSQATVTSSTWTAFGIDNIGCQLVFTGTPTGTFALNVSEDATTWTPLSLAPAPVASGAAGNIMIDLNQQSPPYFQLVYTRTGSSGTLNVLCYGKKI